MKIDSYASSMFEAQQANLNNTTAMLKEKEQEDKKLKEACKGFEAMFLQMMYKEMRNTVPEDSMFGDSNTDKILQDMRDTELVNRMADAGGVGLADVLYKQLKLDQKVQGDMESIMLGLNKKA